MNSTLIIGVNSFLGKYLAKYLNKEAKENLIGIYRESYDDVIKDYYSELFPVEKLDSIRNDIKTVYLLASYIPYSKMNEPNERLVQDNIVLVNKVCQKFKKSKIVFTSSVSVYGENREIPITECSSFINPNLYGLSKISGETILRNHKHFGIIRLSSLYGVGMNNQTFLPKIIEKAKKEKKIILYGNGERKQDYFYVKDAVRLCYEVARYEKNDIFLGVQGDSLSNTQVAMLVQHHLPQVEISFEGKDESVSCVYSSKKIALDLKFQPKYSLKTTISTLLK
jgi:nucleoside-diphosphate-sugar epimerase